MACNYCPASSTMMVFIMPCSNECQTEVFISN
jgi:hypothetical protein